MLGLGKGKPAFRRRKRKVQKSESPATTTAKGGEKSVCHVLSKPEDLRKKELKTLAREEGVIGGRARGKGRGRCVKEN